MAKSCVISAFICLLLCGIPIHFANASDGYCVRLVAYSYVGIDEQGGNNQGFTDYYFRRLMTEQGWKPGYQWCSFFVMAVLDVCGVPNTITGWSPTAYNKKDVIYDDGKFLKSYSEGDVLIMTLSYNDRKGRFKNIGHTGIVVKVGKTSVRTVEGNTNDLGMRDSRTGDGVYVKIRPLNKNIQITRWGKKQN